MRLIGLTRVSTDGQEEEGVSLDAQEAKIRAYSKLYDIDLVAILRDTGSGKDMDRDGLQEALRMLRDGEADGIVVAKLDRLTRSVGDFQLMLETYFSEKAGFILCSVSDSIDTRTASGRLVLNILITVFQWERETISERTREGLRHKKSRGERTGSVPYGKDLASDGVTLIDNLGEQNWIAQIKLWRRQGMTLHWICNALNKNGVPTKKAGQIINGKPVKGKWLPAVVKKLAMQPDGCHLGSG